MARREVLPIAAVLAVLILALVFVLRRRSERREERAAPAPAERESSRNEGAPGEGRGRDPAERPEDGATALHGLRLLSPGVAAARGRRPRPPGDPAREARKLWSRTKVDVRATDQPLDEFLAGLRAKYGLETRLDSQLRPEEHTITFRVDDLAADQALDLIAKMSGLACAIDAAGVMWITTEERAPLLRAPADPEEKHIPTFGMIRFESEMANEHSAPAEPAPWVGKRVTVTIVNQPVRDALDAVFVALEFRSGSHPFAWAIGAGARSAPDARVSLVADDMPAEEAVRSIIAAAGLELDTEYGGFPTVVTPERAKTLREERASSKRALGEEASETAQLRARRVRIQGELLAAADVAGQVAAQLGVTLAVAPEVAEREAAWESDGKEQGAGEVLDQLAKEGALIWKWQGEADPAVVGRHFGLRRLWLVGAKEE